MSLRVVPLELHEANEFVRLWHRHHKPRRAHRFALGAQAADGHIVAAVICGRPVSRGYDPRRVLEVSRLVTNGHRNACSFLYGAAARVGKEMGFERIQTYILPEETGASLRATGWVRESLTRGGQWTHSDDGRERRTDQPTGPKVRWAKELNPRWPGLILPDPEPESRPPSLPLG